MVDILKKNRSSKTGPRLCPSSGFKLRGHLCMIGISESKRSSETGPRLWRRSWAKPCSSPF